jgi:hypothetical protein
MKEKQKTNRNKIGIEREIVVCLPLFSKKRKGVLELHFVRKEIGITCTS